MVYSDVIIVTHNSGPVLSQSVASAIAQAGADHVWVVDTESTDGSLDTFRTDLDARDGRLDSERSPGREETVHVISVPNRGYAAANNRGLEATRAPFALLLNPDAVLQAEALETLEKTAYENPTAGIIGALVLDADGAVQTGSYGRFPSLINQARLHLAGAAQRLAGREAHSPTAPPSTAAVDWVTGAAMLVRRTAIAEVGPLDEGFFLYYEDIDWCRRMRQRGWKVLLEPAAKVLHHRGTSGTSAATVALAYRESFYRYCDLHGLWGLRTVARLGLALRRFKERIS